MYKENIISMGVTVTKPECSTMEDQHSTGTTKKPHPRGFSKEKDTCPRTVCRMGTSEELDGKQVRFELDSENRPIEHLYSYPAIPNELYPLVFWSDQDLRVNRQAQIEKANRIAMSSPQLVESVVRLRAHDSETETETEAARLCLATSGCRGLEDTLLPDLIDYRMWAIRRLLQVQENNQSECPEKVQKQLYWWSKSAGIASARLARQLAEVDAMEACNRMEVKVLVARMRSGSL
jgi:hypothetical protein